MAVVVSFPPEAGVEILLVSPTGPDYARLCHIINHSKWKLHRVLNCEEALGFLRQHPLGVVITEAALPDGNWKDLLAGVARLPVSPNLIVSSGLADEQLWAEVLNLGGYDVLLTPFEADEVFRVGSAAWLSWKRRLEAAVTPPKEPQSIGGPSATQGRGLAVGGVQ